MAPEKFESLCRLATLVCETPFAAVSTVHGGALRFEVALGFEKSRAPAELIFCETVRRESEQIYLHDTRQDPRFRDSVWVNGPVSLHFYAGVPLYDFQGRPYGVLCVADRKPRQLSPLQLAGLNDLAEQARIRSDDHIRRMGMMSAGIMHELNNPMMGLLFQLQKAQTGIDSAAPAVTSTSVTRALQLAERMEEILVTLRTLVRPASASEQAARIDLPSCCNDLQLMLAEKLRKNEVQLKFDVPATISACGHRVMLLQILSNLCLNAIESFEGPSLAPRQIQISASHQIDSRTEKPLVEVRISNNGPGIPKEQQEQILLPFMTTKSHTGGTGLGLALCLEFASKMNAQLLLDVKAPQTTFVLKMNA